MIRASDIARALGLEPHPEGGFFRETHRAGDLVMTPRGPRAASSSILFLVTAGSPSRFHRLANDEIWLYHGGSRLELVTLLPDGRAESVVLAGAGLLVRDEGLTPPGRRRAWCRERAWTGRSCRASSRPHSTSKTSSSAMA